MELLNIIAPPVTSYETHSISQYLWVTLIVDLGLGEGVYDSWKTHTFETGPVEGLGGVLFRYRDDGDGENRLIVQTREGILLRVDLERTHTKVAVSIAGQVGTRQELEQVMRRLRDIYPEARPVEERVPVLFWTVADEGESHSSTERLVETPSWDDVRCNYAASTRVMLDGLMRDFRPGRLGRLLLWYGPPGTGKTWALRALAREWRSWCRVEYVTDPEALLSRGSYMMHVVLDSERAQTNSRWRLLVFEDTGELLAADAKATEGQRLSRLLNICDGFIGQGTRVMVLVTTNDELHTLHPAVSRPGRCASAIEFLPFTSAEAAEWLSAHEMGIEPRSATLAELYGGSAERSSRRRVGFVAQRPGSRR